MPTPEHGHDSPANLRNEHKLQRAPPDGPRVPAFEETFGEGHGNGDVFRHVLIPRRHPLACRALIRCDDLLQPNNSVSGNYV
jgi:hypothetical protein